MATRTRKRNVEMGFRDKQGRFHPIRASKDYIPSLEHRLESVSGRGKKKKKPAAKKRNPVQRASASAIPGKWTTAKVRRVGGKVQVKI
jgi:hypothetical protein